MASFNGLRPSADGSELPCFKMKPRDVMHCMTGDLTGDPLGLEVDEECPAHEEINLY